MNERQETFCDKEILIIGAGPAGLAAAYEATLLGFKPHIVESLAKIGGLARTEEHAGYRFEIGGHRLLSHIPYIVRFWQTMVGNDLLTIPRQSRIYYKQRFFHYPLHPVDTLIKLGPLESLKITSSYLAAKISPPREEQTFEQWVIRRFGRRLYETFFKTYTEKVWGIPCNVLRADWAAQRIKGLSFTTAVLSALGLRSRAKTLSDRFFYPRLGLGMLWERMLGAICRAGGQIALNAHVVSVEHAQGLVRRVSVATAEGVKTFPVKTVISSMPLNALIHVLDPPPPSDVLEAASGLKHRAFAMVQLGLKRPHLFPYHWIYIHEPYVRVGRVQNFGNWSMDLLPSPDRTSLGMEYFCSVGDEIWSLADEALIALAIREMEQLGLAQGDWVESATVVRYRNAYPVYDTTYRKRVQVLRQYLSTFQNLQTIGRSGMHRYNNLDHSMWTGILAARNLAGAGHDLWQVNAEHEEAIG